MAVIGGLVIFVLKFALISSRRYTADELSEICRGRYDVVRQICRCPPTRTGPYCQFPVCEHGKLNRAFAFRLEDYKCNCYAGYKDELCDQIRCYYGTEINKTSCDCAVYYKGRFCNITNYHAYFTDQPIWVSSAVMYLAGLAYLTTVCAFYWGKTVVIAIIVEPFKQCISLYQRFKKKNEKQENPQEKDETV